MNIWGLAQDAITSETTMKGVMYLVGILVAWILKKKATKKWDLQRIVLASEVAVKETYEEYVRATKSANQDGKLTQDERAVARTFAFNRLKDILSEKGIDLAKYYGPRLAKFLIDRAVGRSKLAGRIAAAALRPLQEPELPLG